MGHHREDLSAWLDDGRLWYARDGGTETALLLNRWGGRLSVAGVESRIRRLAAASLDEGVTPHALRHSVATHFLEAGMSIERIASFLGHKRLSATQIYTHILEREHARE